MEQNALGEARGILEGPSMKFHRLEFLCTTCLQNTQVRSTLQKMGLSSDIPFSSRCSPLQEGGRDLWGPWSFVPWGPVHSPSDTHRGLPFAAQRPEPFGLRGQVGVMPGSSHWGLCGPSSPCSPSEEGRVGSRKKHLLEAKPTTQEQLVGRGLLGLLQHLNSSFTCKMGRMRVLISQGD